MASSVLQTTATGRPGEIEERAGELAALSRVEDGPKVFQQRLGENLVRCCGLRVTHVRAHNAMGGFGAPEQRRISIDQYRWKDHGANGKIGSGNVSLVTMPLDGSPQTNGAGSIRLEVQLYPAGLKIKGMYYNIKSR